MKRLAKGLLILAVVLCGCSASPIPTLPPKEPVSPAATPTPTSAAPAACEATLPHTSSVDELKAVTPLPADRFAWYGGRALAVMLPRDGVYRAATAAQLAAKLPWYRFRPGAVEIVAERTDATAERVLSRTSDGYGSVGFNPSEIVFSSEGCWRITGDLEGDRLTFVVYVRRAKPGERMP